MKKSQRIFFTLHNIPFSLSPSPRKREKKSETNMSKTTHTRVILRILPRKKDKNKNPQPVKLVSSLALSSSLVLVIYLFNLNFVSFLCAICSNASLKIQRDIEGRGEKPSLVYRDLEREICSKEFLLFSVLSRSTLTFLRLLLEILRLRVNEKENSFYQ